MRIRALSIFIASAALLAGCGTGTTSHTAALSRATAPAVTVTPDTGLTGGQPLEVRLAGFPADSWIQLYECVAGDTCGPGGASPARTGSTGSASATFIAQASVTIGTSSTPTPCARQCQLVAVAFKKTATRTTTTGTATARLFFATAGGPVDLADSSLLSTSWISATEGWALAEQPCPTGTCARVARTTDGGQHWQVLPGPAAGVQGETTSCLTRTCVSQVSFASPAVGYLYGPSLLMTTDGGLTWHAEPGQQTETLTVAGGQVYRVAYPYSGCPGPCQPVLQEAPPGSADWRTLIGPLAYPDRSGSAQIAVSGADVLVALYGSLAGPLVAHAYVYRSVDGGRTWTRAADPCAGFAPADQEDDLLAVAAAPGGFFGGVCVQRVDLSTFVITSARAGANWRPAASRPRRQWPGILAMAGPGTIAVVTGPPGGNAALQVTTDGGRHWLTVATDTPGLTAGSAPDGLSFETPLDGQWLGDPHGIWTTTDGGLRWTRMAFR